MTSGAVTMKAVVDAWMTDLVANVSGLSTAIQHSAAPWDPELLAVMQSERHVAIFPDASSAQQSSDEWTDADEVAIQFHVLIWEEAGEAQSRLKGDYTADWAFLTICEDARDRFYITANRTKANTQETHFRTMELSSGSGSIRMADITFEVRTLASFS